MNIDKFKWDYILDFCDLIASIIAVSACLTFFNLCFEADGNCVESRFNDYFYGKEGLPIGECWDIPKADCQYNKDLVKPECKDELQKFLEQEMNHIVPRDVYSFPKITSGVWKVKENIDFNCWDLNKNDVCDKAEDRNGDNKCGVEDCAGTIYPDYDIHPEAKISRSTIRVGPWEPIDSFEIKVPDIKISADTINSIEITYNGNKLSTSRGGVKA